MKKKTINSLIQECIREVINEDVTGSVNLSAKDPRSQDPNYIKRYTQQGVNVQISEEENLEEMARIASRYKLANNWKESYEELDPKLKNKWTNEIIKFLQDPELCPDGEASIAKMAKDIWDKPQQAIFMLVTKALVPKGVLEPTYGEAIDKTAAFKRAKEKAAEKGEDFDEEDALYSGWETPPKFRDFFSGDEPDPLFVGPHFSDDFGNNGRKHTYKDDLLPSDEDNINDENPEGGETLHSAEPKKDKRKSTASISSVKGSNARAQAAEWFSDDQNDRDLTKLIALQSTKKLKESKRMLKEAGGISSSDVEDSEKKRKVRAGSELDKLIQDYAEKIKLEDPAVQRAIIDMLSHKLPGNNQMLYKKIVAAVGLPSAEDVVKHHEKLKQDAPLSDEDIEDIVDSEEDVHNSSDLPSDELEESKEDYECGELNEDMKRLQHLAGIIK